MEAVNTVLVQIECSDYREIICLIFDAPVVSCLAIAVANKEKSQMSFKSIIGLYYLLLLNIYYTGTPTHIFFSNFLEYLKKSPYS